jgi:hypothetical protein
MNREYGLKNICLMLFKLTSHLSSISYEKVKKALREDKKKPLPPRERKGLLNSCSDNNLS